MPFLTSSHPRISQTKEVFGCQWFRVHEERWGSPSDSQSEPYYRIESSDGVLVLALTKTGEFILVRQFRPVLRKTTIEFPAGGIEKGENPDQAAARELLEETGYRAGLLSLLGCGHIMMNRYSARDYLFLAQHCEVKQDRTNGARLQSVVVVQPQKFKDLVLEEKFEHIPALSLISLAEWKLGRRLVA